LEKKFGIYLPSTVTCNLYRKTMFSIESFRKEQLLKKQQEEAAKNSSSLSKSDSQDEIIISNNSNTTNESESEFKKKANSFPVGVDRRQKALEMYHSLNNMVALANKRDYIPPEYVNPEDLDGFSLDYCNEEISKLGIPTREELVFSRTLVDEILQNHQPFVVEGIISMVKIKEHLDLSLSPLLLKKKESSNFTNYKKSLGVEVYGTSSIGNRKSMEDYYTIFLHLNEFLKLQDPNNNNEIAFFGLYDGHVGKIAAEYTRAHLHLNIARNLGFNTNTENTFSCIHNGFLKTSDNFNKIAKKHTISAGSTAVIIFLKRDSLYIANVGDSEAVLCRNGIAVILTNSHQPNNEDEKLRIEKAGGKVVWFGTWRVNGLLSVSRSIGDPQLENVVIAEPFMNEYKRTSEDEFIIMASDGLWDVFKHQEICDFIRQLLNQSNSKQNIGKLIIEEALRRKTTDNVSVILLFFN